MLQCTKLQQKYCTAQNAAEENRHSSMRLSPPSNPCRKPKFRRETKCRNWMRATSDAVVLGLEMQRAIARGPRS
jgi:hypothetical protein